MTEILKSREIIGLLSGIPFGAHSETARICPMRFGRGCIPADGEALLGHMDGVSGMSTGPEGRHVVTSSREGSVRIWNLNAKACIEEVCAR